MNMTMQAIDLSTVTIIELQPAYVAQAKHIFYQIVYEFQLIPCTTVQEAADILIQKDICGDYDNHAEHYFNKCGIFFVVLHNQQVIGTGALRYFDDTTCELKRFYFMPEARGKGIATALMHKLMDFARQLGYTKILLEVYRPQVQSAAVAFYTKLGFYIIAPYRESSAQLQMEKYL